MIGVFDSGVGGLVSYRKLRELLPSERIVYLADTESAPYGTKSEEELRRLIDADISRLRSLGCDYILAACCTASAVIEKMPKECRSSIGTLIEPTAILASRTEGTVAVIATEYTAKSHAFKNAIARLDPTKCVVELAEQGLVTLVEQGARDGFLDPESEGYLDRLAGRIKESGATALILGCTHFSHLSGELGKRLPELSIISPALEGARMAARMHRCGAQDTEPTAKEDKSTDRGSSPQGIRNIGSEADEDRSKSDPRRESGINHGFPQSDGEWVNGEPRRESGINHGSTKSDGERPHGESRRESHAAPITVYTDGKRRGTQRNLGPSPTKI